MVLPAAAERIRVAIYRELAETGRLTRTEDMAAAYGVADAELDAALIELALTRHIVLRDGEVEMAHPFATRSFGFSVMGPRTLWWGGCAWDAFAIPHLVPMPPRSSSRRHVRRAARRTRGR